jgi:hypothetical protein
VRLRYEVLADANAPVLLNVVCEFIPSEAEAFGIIFVLRL